MEVIQTIKSSFESWYNKNISKESPVTILINYSDEQKLSIRAFHTVTVVVQTLREEEGYPILTPLLKLQENYNHGITTAEEAKAKLMEKLLFNLYGFSN